MLTHRAYVIVFVLIVIEVFGVIRIRSVSRTVFNVEAVVFHIGFYPCT